MKKILTILIPVYNTEKYIRRCLDSILLNEILEDIEVIIVSDGSKDGSVDIIKKEYITKYKDTIILVEKENGGHGSTINKGIEIASGKYFRVLDSDDWVNSVDFIKFVNRLKNEKADLVVCDYSQEKIYENSRTIFEFKNLLENNIYDFDSFDLNDLAGEYFVMAMSTYKLDILKKSKIHLLEKTFYVDMQYNIESIINVKSFVYYKLNIYRYYIGRKDQSTNIDSYSKNKLHHEKVMKYLLEFYSKLNSNVSNNKKKYIKQILIYMLYTHYVIFCSYDKNYIESYNLITNFDKYFLNINKSLYFRMNEMSLINAHRKTNFKFVKTKSKLLKKLFNNLYKIIGM